jgi:hypothetical protein
MQKKAHVYQDGRTYLPISRIGSAPGLKYNPIATRNVLFLAYSKGITSSTLYVSTQRLLLARFRRQYPCYPQLRPYHIQLDIRKENGILPSTRYWAILKRASTVYRKELF